MVINGARPSSKADNLETILSRIPAGQVVRVELAPGDLYGADYAGKSQVLNVVLSSQGGIDGNATVSARRLYTGKIVPDGSVSAMIRKGPLRFELFDVAGAAPLPDDRRHPPLDLMTHGNKHVAFCVRDLDACQREFEGHGVEVVFVVREAFGAGFFIRDCAGNLIEFVEEPNQ